MLGSKEIQKTCADIQLLANELDEKTQVKLYELIVQYGSMMYRTGAKDFDKNLRSTTVGGIRTPQEVIDLISVLYPDYEASGSGYDIQANNRRYNLLMADYKQLTKKEEFAISGAMRWKFSQEAPTWINNSYSHTDYKPNKV